MSVPNLATSPSLKRKTFRRLPHLFSSATFPRIKDVSLKEEQFVLL